jgi:hypothetical protein
MTVDGVLERWREEWQQSMAVGKRMKSRGEISNEWTT